MKKFSKSIRCAPVMTFPQFSLVGNSAISKFSTFEEIRHNHALGKKFFNDGHHKSAKKYFALALGQVKSRNFELENNSLTQGILMSDLAITEFLLGKEPHALNMFRSSINLLKQFDDADTIRTYIETVLALTVLLEKKGKLAEAVETVTETLKIVKKAPNNHLDGLAMLMGKLGHLESIQDNYEAADDWLTQAKELMEENSQANSRAYGSLLISLGNIRFFQGNMPDTIVSLKEGINTFKKIIEGLEGNEEAAQSLDIMLVVARLRLAFAYLVTQDHSRATSIANRVIRMFRALPEETREDTILMSSTYLAFGITQWIKKDIKLAHQSFDTSFQLVESHYRLVVDPIVFDPKVYSEEESQILSIARSFLCAHYKISNE